MDEKSPVSFDVKINRLPAKGMPVSIVADEDVRAALADAHGLLGVSSFEAELGVSNWKRGGISVTGRVRAEIVQACIASLEPIAAMIDEPVDALFLPRASRLARFEDDPSGELLIDPDGPDAPELFDGDAVDVGALAEQVFAVAIDPYPRAAGAGLEAPGGAEDAVASPGPLAEQLAILKARR